MSAATSDDRRRFLSRLAAGGLAAGSLPSLLHALEPTRAETAHASNLNVSELREQMRELDEQPSMQPQFDVSWAQRVTGKYKTVFDVPEINGGSGVWRAGLSRNHYRDLMGATPADLSPVIVIRHAAIPLIMSHEFWDTYDIAKSRKVMHPMTDKETRRNPVLMTAEDDALPASYASMTLDKQMEQGTIVLGCNAAFGQLVSMVRRKEQLESAAARERAISMMLPGVILQPNGIFGVSLAQDVGCSFVAAS
jgi:hypothetical protein